MEINELKRELERTYRVLSPEEAESQNEWDIHVWRDCEHFVSNDEAKELFRFNKELYRQNALH